MISKGTEIRLPEGWKALNLSFAADIIMGQSPSSSSYNRSADGLPFFQGKADFSDEYKMAIRQWTSEPTKLSEPGDVLLSVRAPVGDVAMNRVKACIGRGLAAVRAKQRVSDPRFLFYILQSLKGSLNTNAQGSTFVAVNGSALNKLHVLLPSLREQKKIAEVLGSVDEDIEKIQELIEMTEKLKRGLMQQLFTRGIGHTKFKKIKIGEIPKEWEIVGLEDISKNLDNKRIPITKSKRRAGQYPYYGATGIVDYVNNYIFDDSLLLISEDGANLKDRNYPIAFTATGKYWVNNHAHVQKFDDKYLHKYVQDYLNMINLEQYLTGMAQPKLNKDRLFTILIPQPKQLSEIKKIVEILSAVDGKISVSKKLKRQFVLFKKGLMQDLLSGKIRVVNKD